MLDSVIAQYICVYYLLTQLDTPKIIWRKDDYTLVFNFSANILGVPLVYHFYCGATDKLL